MIPELAGVSTYQSLWIGALFSVLGVALLTGRRVQVPPRRMLAATSLLIVAAMAGSKLYWMVETGRGIGDLGGLWRGHRSPGALLGGVAALPIAVRLVHLRSAAALGDALAPAFCIALAAVRAGCFLNGCCSGQACALPWAVRFPTGSDAWTYQVFARVIPPSETLSVPVHPLQLYLAAAGVLIGLIGMNSISRRRFDGEVLLGCVAAWAATEAALYGLRYQYSSVTHYLLVVIASTCTVGLVALPRLRKTAFIADPASVG